MAMLSIVPTPIGNLQDITIRAITTLFASDYILAEETMRTKNLLLHLKERYPFLVGEKPFPKMIQMNEFSENTQLEKYTRLFEGDTHISLISSAGTPLFSDPGYRLVQFALTHDVQLISLPGPTAAIPALTLSGYSPAQSLFLGFLPKSNVKKEKILKTIQSKTDKMFHPTLIIYESPHRLIETLTVIHTVFGNIQVFIARELTKVHEEHIHDTVINILHKYKTEEARGEYVLVLEST